MTSQANQTIHAKVTTNGAMPQKPTVRQQSRKRMFVGLALLIVLLTEVGHWFQQESARQEVIGIVDAKTGLRGVFSISRGWQAKAYYKNPGGVSTVEQQTYETEPPGQIRAWLDMMLVSPNTALFKFSDTLTFLTWRGERHSEFQLVDGYPAVLTKTPTMTAMRTVYRSLSERHITMDNQPATVQELEVTFAGGPPLHTIFLIIKKQDAPLWYSVQLLFDPLREDAAQQEMQRILASFHIERAATVAQRL